MKTLPAFFLALGLQCTAQVWTQLPDFPGNSRDDGVSVTVDGVTYFGTGLQPGFLPAKDFYSFDPSSNTWSALPDMPYGSARQYAVAFAGKHCFYVAGGDAGGPLSTFYKYDIVKQAWSRLPDLPMGGLMGAITLQFGDDVLVVGGRLASGTHRQAWMFHTDIEQWERKRNVPFTGRWRACGTSYKIAGFMMFGIDSLGAFHDEIYRYNYLSDTWTLHEHFPYGNSLAYATAQIMGNQLVVFAGNDSTWKPVNNFWYLDLFYGTWMQGPGIPAGARKGGMSAVVNGRFMYTCGINASDTRLKETWMMESSVGLSENTMESLLLYPQPARDEVSIHGLNADARVVVSTIAGDRVLEIVQPNRKIDVSMLPAGMYLMTVFRTDAPIANLRLVIE